LPDGFDARFVDILLAALHVMQKGVGLDTIAAHDLLALAIRG